MFDLGTEFKSALFVRSRELGVDQLIDHDVSQQVQGSSAFANRATELCRTPVVAVEQRKLDRRSEGFGAHANSFTRLRRAQASAGGLRELRGEGLRRRTLRSSATTPSWRLEDQTNIPAQDQRKRHWTLEPLGSSY